MKAVFPYRYIYCKGGFGVSGKRDLGRHESIVARGGQGHGRWGAVLLTLEKFARAKGKKAKVRDVSSLSRKRLD